MGNRPKNNLLVSSLFLFNANRIVELRFFRATYLHTGLPCVDSILVIVIGCGHVVYYVFFRVQASPLLNFKLICHIHSTNTPSVVCGWYIFFAIPKKKFIQLIFLIFDQFFKINLSSTFDRLRWWESTLNILQEDKPRNA